MLSRLAEQVVKYPHPARTAIAAQDYLGVTLDNRFRIDALIGAGGMADVYRASDVVLDRTVAIKLLRHDIVEEQEQLTGRFLREARAVAKIEHPNVVKIYDIGLLGRGGLYLVMEFIKGCSLRDLMRNQALSPALAVTVMKQVCSAVAAAHQAGIIHRDLKPENIMLKQHGGQIMAKVVDLGVAKLVESMEQSLTRLTPRNQVLGTPYYMSPEQCLTSKIDARSDIYALGVILYEMIVSAPPFQGTIAEIMRQHLYTGAVRPSERNIEIPAVLEELMLKMLRKSKDERPALASIVTMLSELETAFGPLAQAAQERFIELFAEACRLSAETLCVAESRAGAITVNQSLIDTSALRELHTRGLNVE